MLKKGTSKQAKANIAENKKISDETETIAECKKEVKNPLRCALDLENLYSLGNMLADKFALAVEQLGSDGEEIDTNRLKQLVGVMKDLTGIAENEESISDNPEKKQKEFVDIIKLAVGICEKDIREDVKDIPQKEAADIAL